jgi:hypothetical protein
MVNSCEERNSDNEITWFIPLKISDKNNYLEFKVINVQGSTKVDKVELVETSINPS